MRGLRRGSKLAANATSTKIEDRGGGENTRMKDKSPILPKNILLKGHTIECNSHVRVTWCT